MTIGIHQILPSVAAAVGVQDADNVLGLPQAKRYVVYVVDGLGQMLLAQHAAEAPWLSSLPSVDGVLAGVPSTTSASMTSLGTGLRPGQHGMVGYTVRIPGTTNILNTLTWDADIDPVDWQPHDSVLRGVAEAGVATTIVNEARFADSGLTLCSQRGVPYVGVSSPWERIDALCDAVEATPRAVVQGYESRLDHTGHGRGVDSNEWRDVLRRVDSELAELRAALPADTVLLITADHGMLDLGDDDRVEIDEVESLNEDLTVLAGEARLRHLFTRSGAEEQVAERWRRHFGDEVEVRLRDDTEEWFGPIADIVRPRIGDVVVAARAQTSMMSSSRFAVEMTLRGFHGGLTDIERKIPVLVAE